MFHLLFNASQDFLGRVNKSYDLRTFITISNVETIFNLKRYTHTKWNDSLQFTFVPQRVKIQPLTICKYIIKLFMDPVPLLMSTGRKNRGSKTIKRTMDSSILVLLPLYSNLIPLTFADVTIPTELNPSLVCLCHVNFIFSSFVSNSSCSLQCKCHSWYQWIDVTQNLSLS